MRKLLLTAALLLATATATSALTRQENLDLCAAWGSAAANIMRVRQQDIPVSEIVKRWAEVVPDSTEGELAMVQKIAEHAWVYMSYIPTTDGSSDRLIEAESLRFGAKIEANCLAN